MKQTTLAAAMMLAVGLGASACGPDVPANPDWTIDVQPILVARCLRCHDSPPRTDPLVNRAVYNPALTIPLSSGSAGAILSSVKGATKIMPPPPAAPLEDWQIQIIQNYVNTHK